MRFFRKALDCKPERRCEIKDMGKYINDNWLRQTKTSHDSDFEDDVTDSDHMDKLTNILQDHGIETKVNKT
jgi:hypothetical protein